jgi:hypothetical protein
MVGPNSQAGWGKMAQHRLWAFIKEVSLRKLACAQESLVGAELLLGMAPFLK